MSQLKHLVTEEILKICTIFTSTSGAGHFGRCLSMILLAVQELLALSVHQVTWMVMLFSGMREHMRKICDEIWIIDLGGEGRGTHKSENVFAIQTPVAIAIAIRTKQAELDKPATVRFVRIDGTRTEKLAKLDSIHDFDAVKWLDCPTGWQDPFRPMVENKKYFSWPLLTDLMPWQHSGVQLKRTWPIAADLEMLGRRWDGLMQAADRGYCISRN